MKPTQTLHDAGQSLWLDNIARGLLDNGTLERYIHEFSISGLTSNPTIFDHAIAHSQDYDAAIRRQFAAGARGEARSFTLAIEDLGSAIINPAVTSAEALFFTLAIEDLTRAADLFRPIHDRTDGVDGWVSLEVSPQLAHDTAGTIAAAKRLHAQAARPNLFIKIPGTPEGAPAIEEAIFAGVPINVTLLFSREQYLVAADAYMRGIERRLAAGLFPVVGSIASLFVSRWDKAVLDTAPATLRDKLGVAVAQRTYKAYRDVLNSDRWLQLANAGARPQRLLWASTGTKDPAASDVLYISALAAPFTVNTIPDATLLAFAEHGTIDGMLPADGGDAEAVLAEFARAGIDYDGLAAQLQRDGAADFVTSWNDLLESMASKRTALMQAT